jgi:hypothetical protein
MDPDPVPNPYKIITDPALDPGGPKTYKPDPEHWFPGGIAEKQAK